jgi:hypothetical protein
MRRISALAIFAGNVFTASLATSSSYFYAVTPLALDAGSTRRGRPLPRMIDWWSSWAVPPSSSSIFEPMAFLLDFLFWLALLLVPAALFFAQEW